MRINPLNYPKKPARRLRQGVVRVNAFYGGAKAPLAKHWLQQPNTINIAFDNQREIQDFRDAHVGFRFWTFVMGEGETSWSLLPNSVAANSTLFGGFGARLELARAAAERLIASETFLGFCQSLADQILILTNGSVELIEFYGLGSICGAGCAGASVTISRAMLPYLLKLGCPVELIMDVLEADSFLGLAERARENSAAATLSQCALMLDGSRELASVPKYLFLHAQPPFLDDIQRRNRYLLLDAIAMHSAQMDDHFGLIRPNLSGSHPCGNILSRDVDFMEGLDCEQHVASRTAVTLRDQLLVRMETARADLLLVDGLRWQDDSTDQSREELSSLGQRLMFTSTEELIEAITKSPADFHFRIFAGGAHGGEFLLEKLNETFSMTPNVLEEFLQRLRLIRTFQVLIEGETQWVLRELRKLQPSVLALKGKAADLHHKVIQGHGLFPRANVRRLLAVARKLREQSGLLALRTAEEEALGRAAWAISHELVHQQGMLEGIVQRLDGFVPRGSLQEIPYYVVTRSVDDVFPVLLRLPTLDRTTQLQKLCSAASQLLPQGLAKIAGIQSDRLGEIAHAIVNGQYSIIAPTHGGKKRQYRAKPIYALPPVDAHTEEHLPALIRRLRPDAKVVFNDTMEFGTTVARIHLRRYSSMGQVFEGLPSSDLIESMSGKQASLNLPKAHALLQQLGGRIVGNRLEFPGDSEH